MLIIIIKTVYGFFYGCKWTLFTLCMISQKAKETKTKKKQLISIIIYSAAFTKEITARKESIDNYNKIGKQY